MVTCFEVYETLSVEDKYSPNSKDFLSAMCTVGEYFVIGRTLKGGRHISPTVNWKTAIEIYKDYIDIVEYFGGGTVTLYELNIDDYEVVLSDVIW